MCTHSPNSGSENFNEQRHAETMVANLRQRLYKLEETRAAYGLDTSPHILTEIDDLERLIYHWEETLKRLKQNCTTSRVVADPVSQRRIQLFLPATFSTLSAAQQSLAIAVLTAALNTEPEMIEVYHVVRT